MAGGTDKQEFVGAFVVVADLGHAAHQMAGQFRAVGMRRRVLVECLKTTKCQSQSRTDDPTDLFEAGHDRHNMRPASQQERLLCTSLGSAMQPVADFFRVERLVSVRVQSLAVTHCPERKDRWRSVEVRMIERLEEQSFAVEHLTERSDKCGFVGVQARRVHRAVSPSRADRAQNPHKRLVDGGAFVEPKAVNRKYLLA